MRWSKLFIPTLRDDPAEAETASHGLLLRAGYIRQLAAGVYSHLFLSQRCILKITAILREEMNRIGAQEFHLPVLNSAGSTQEEVMTSIARGELRSYKQFPQIWYQIQTRFRDEVRPKSGLRVRQCLVQDSCSFDMEPEALDIAYQKHREAYERIFERCGLKLVSVEAQSQAVRFMVASEDGEDLIVVCPKCSYAANLENATARASTPAQPDPEGDLDPEEFHTPDRKTIAEVADFTRLPETSQMKSLVMVVSGKPVLALVRGDHQLSESKLAEALGGVAEVRAAFPPEIQEWFGASAGSLGPIGVSTLRIVADLALEGRRNMIAGANKDDYHLRNVTPGEDFRPEFRDIRQVAAGDLCSSCGNPLELRKAIEVGRIFKLGSKYSEAMGLRVLDPAGKEVAPIMGSYGIAIERILTSAVEQHHDADGMMLPRAIAPFDVVITPVFMGEGPQKDAAESIYRDCLALGLDTLLDDRDDRPGVKFKDADLIGIPCRITVGRKAAEGLVEVVVRRTKEKMDVPVGAAAAWVSGSEAAGRTAS